MVELRGTALARVAASSDPLRVRAHALLLALRSVVPFDGAWIAVADRPRSTYVSLASVGLDDGVVDFLGGPHTAHDIAVTGADQQRPPVSVSDLPDTTQLTTWSDCLIPAGFPEFLAIALFAPGSRHVGFVLLLFRTQSPPSPELRRRLGEAAPVLALGIDPMPSLLGVARVVRGATAGRLLRDDGLTDSLSGMDGDGSLLDAGSPALAIACQRLVDGIVHSSFLWPLGGWHAPDGHARVTVLAAPDDLPQFVGGVALVSPSGDLHDLTPRELEVLGLLIHGCSNQEIARTFMVAARTVATHVEHVLAKLDVRTRTLAAVRAEREGLYVPVGPGSPYEDPTCGDRGD